MSILEVLPKIPLAMYILGLLIITFFLWVVWISVKDAGKKAREAAEYRAARKERLRRYSEMRTISDAISHTERGSDDEERCLALLDKMNPSYEEFHSATFSLEHGRPRIIERKIKLLEARNNLQ